MAEEDTIELHLPCDSAEVDSDAVRKYVLLRKMKEVRQDNDETREMASIFLIYVAEMDEYDERCEREQYTKKRVRRSKEL